MFAMKILAVSDDIVPWIHSAQLEERCADVDVIISCGDLPFDYMDFIVARLNKPAYFVHGNHDPSPERGNETKKLNPDGWINLDVKRERQGNFRLTGLEGCHRYKNDGVHQYTQSEQWLRGFWLARQMAQGLPRWGRGTDIMVTHSPMRGIHDATDQAHQGFDAFNWLAKSFQPRLWLHGHQHRTYNPLQKGETQLGNTLVVNVHPYRILELEDVCRG